MKLFLPILEKGYSRIPVFHDKMDNIKGILYIKDLLPNLENPNFVWQDILKTPIYVPENKKLDDLLKEFPTKEDPFSNCS
jgi:CBS domain containing-hemolysin-like protein